MVSICDVVFNFDQYITTLFTAMYSPHYNSPLYPVSVVASIFFSSIDPFVFKNTSNNEMAFTGRSRNEFDGAPNRDEFVDLRSICGLTVQAKKRNLLTADAFTWVYGCDVKSFCPTPIAHNIASLPDDIEEKIAEAGLRQGTYTMGAIKLPLDVGENRFGYRTITYAFTYCQWHEVAPGRLNKKMFSVGEEVNIFIISNSFSHHINCWSQRV